MRMMLVLLSFITITCLHSCVNLVYGHKNETLALELDLLVPRLLALEKSLSEVRDFEDQGSRMLRSFSRELASWQGSGCGDSWLQHQCSDSWGCIPNYLVCDGYDHCPNGEDEQDCDMSLYFKEGDIFDGISLYDTCTSFNDEKYAMRIDALEGHDHAPNLWDVHMTYINILKVAGLYHAVGRMPGVRRGAARQIFVEAGVPLEGIHIIYEFDLADRNLLMEYEVLAGSGNVCAAYRLVRRSSDEPFPFQYFYQ